MYVEPAPTGFVGANVIDVFSGATQLRVVKEPTDDVTRPPLRFAPEIFQKYVVDGSSELMCCVVAETFVANSGGSFVVPRKMSKGAPAQVSARQERSTLLGISVAPFVGETSVIAVLPLQVLADAGVNERTGVVAVWVASHDACATTVQYCVPLRGVTVIDVDVVLCRNGGGFTLPK